MARRERPADRGQWLLPLVVAAVVIGAATMLLHPWVSPRRNPAPIAIVSSTTPQTVAPSTTALPPMPVTDSALLGTQWTLTLFRMPSGSAVYDVDSDPPFLTFADDGTFSVNDGCFGWTGRASVLGPTITFVPADHAAVVQRAACGEMDAILARPRITWSHTARTLTLTSGADELVLQRFEPTAP